MAADGEHDDFEALDLEDYPNLAAVARLAGVVPHVAWFAAVGTPLGEDERAEALDYLSALGFPDAHVAEVAEWEEAAEAARNPEWNTAWWEAEEQLRAGLIVEALELIEESELKTALDHVTASASEGAQRAAIAAVRAAGVVDEALVRAAAGAAIQASYQAALLLAAGAAEDHAFAIKFRLFEAGRWPLGVTGSTFNLF